MSNRIFVSLALLCVLLFGSLAESSSAQDQSEDEKQKEATYLGKTIRQWISDLKSGPTHSRINAAISLPRFGPKGVPALIEALKDEDGRVRLYAAAALGQIGPEAEAVPALIEALKDEDGRVRLYAVYALGQIGPEAKDAVPALKSMSESDPSSNIRAWANNALKRIGR